MEEAKLIKRFLEELKHNKEILMDIDYLIEKCPTYMSLIDKNELVILSECLPTESIHISCDESICPEKMSDTEYEIYKNVSGARLTFVGIAPLYNSSVEVITVYKNKAKVPTLITVACVDTALLAFTAASIVSFVKSKKGKK